MRTARRTHTFTESVIREMTRLSAIHGAIILAAALSSAAVGAQSGGEMARSDKMDNMKKMDASYTGCIESGAGPGTFGWHYMPEKLAWDAEPKSKPGADTNKVLAEANLAKGDSFMYNDALPPRPREPLAEQPHGGLILQGH